jgi:ELWxxDGT repeat protein
MAAPRLVKTIRPGSFTALPSNLTAAGNTLFFLADDGSTGRSLWKSDGTSAGTVLVKDQLPGSLANPFALSAGRRLEQRLVILCFMSRTVVMSCRNHSGNLTVVLLGPSGLPIPISLSI